MSSKLDKALGEIIAEEGRGAGRGGRGRGRGRGGFRGGAARRFDDDRGGYVNPLLRTDDDDDGYYDGPVRRPASYRRGRDERPYSRGAQMDRVSEDDVTEWKHDKFYATQAGGSGGTRVEPVSKILVSNLDSGITAEEVKDIFTAVGSVKTAVIHYDQHGNSLGTAEVTFTSSKSATKAVEEYNGAEVDGVPMYLKVIGELITEAPARIVTPRRFEPAPRAVRRGGGYGGKDAYFGRASYDDYDNYDRPARPFYGRGRGRGGGFRGSSGGRGRGGRGGFGRGGRFRDEKPVTEADLDAELASYQASRSTGKSADSAAVSDNAGQPPSVSA